ncbi:MAG: polysaccharide biosynthesis C-terminal domain-containing protein [Breznakibacter sp.]|nr:polysaccharide biosynthesis C-terminal domain-containing protein [Breznakibacter sp.]
MINRIILTFFSRFLTAILGLFIAVLVSNYLGAEGRGMQALFLANVTFVVHVLGILGSESISILHAKTRRYDYLWISYLWALLVFVLASCVIVLYFQWVPNIWHILMVGLLVSLTASNMSICIAAERTHLYNLLQLLVPVITVAYVFVRLWAYGSITFETYLSSLYVAYGIVFLLSFLIFNFRALFLFHFFGRRFVRSCRYMFQYGFHNQLAVVIQLISYRGCFYLIGISYGDSAIGVYANSVSITEAVWIVSRSIGFVIFSRFINQKQPKAHRKVLQRALTINVFVLLVCFFALAAIPGSLYAFVFGSEFFQLKHLILSLLPSSLIYGQSLLIFNYFSGTRKHYVNTISNGMGALVLMLSGIVLIPKFGNYGAIIATTIGYSTLFVLQNFFLKKYLDISLFRNSFSLKQLLLFYRYFRIVLSNWLVQR